MATVPQLKALAKELGIKVTGLNKAELEKAIDAKYREMDSKGMSPAKRVAAYTAQRNGGTLSFRQSRRVRKAENKAKGF